jgi:hypothetical protein
MDLLITAVGKHVVEIFRDGDPIVGAVPRKSTFRRLPIARHVDLSLDRAGRGPRSIDGLWVSDTKIGGADTGIRTTDEDPRGARWVGSIRGGVVIGVREIETLREVDDIFQSLVNRMELPLLLCSVAGDWER